MTSKIELTLLFHLFFGANFFKCFLCEPAKPCPTFAKNKQVKRKSKQNEFSSISWLLQCFRLWKPSVPKKFLKLLCFWENPVSRYNLNKNPKSYSSCFDFEYRNLVTTHSKSCKKQANYLKLLKGSRGIKSLKFKLHELLSKLKGGRGCFFVENQIR